VIDRESSTRDILLDARMSRVYTSTHLPIYNSTHHVAFDAAARSLDLLNSSAH
jgi:hypothetical protein